MIRDKLAAFLGIASAIVGFSGVPTLRERTSRPVLKSRVGGRRGSTNARHGAAGLVERLHRAKSSAEISVLLAEGARYERASGKTERKWDAAAAARRRALKEGR